MKTISWNCRGFGNPPAVRASLVEAHKKRKSQVVLLMETKFKVTEMESIKRRTDFDLCLAVGCERNGREMAGGIALLSQKNVSPSIITYSLNHIHCSCMTSVYGEEWFMIGVYAYSEEQNKWRTWEMIKSIGSNMTRPWVCFGDLNDTVANHEKKGETLDPIANSHKVDKLYLILIWWIWVLRDTLLHGLTL